MKKSVFFPPIIFVLAFKTGNFIVPYNTKLKKRYGRHTVWGGWNYGEDQLIDRLSVETFITLGRITSD